MKKGYLSILMVCAIASIMFACGNIENKKENVINQDGEVTEEENVKDATKTYDIKSLNLDYLSDDVLFTKRINLDDRNDDILFTEKYTDVEGILTFRGNNFRTAPSYGKANVKNKKINQKWTFTTSSSTWGGGAGWTGQAAMVKWDKETKLKMNMTDEFKNKDNGVEVIYASLDGNIYFLDYESGEQTREAIRVGNPIKGSVSIDPRGYPLLYIGEGINERESIGFNIYSLINGEKLYEISNDKDAIREWGAFDSSAIVAAEQDSVIVPGENGLIYKIKLNTQYDEDSISINPEVGKYIYDAKDLPGVENSIVTYANLGFFADNKGFINCIDLNTMKPVWQSYGSDDTDATLVLDIEDNKPFLYSGNEVDIQGSRGNSTIKKVDGLTGEFLWEKDFECESLIGSNPVNGGMLSTPVVGKGNMSDICVFSLSRYDGFNAGLLVALDKKTGEIVWSKNLDSYAWSSPLDFYDSEGNGYILQGDSKGELFLIDGKTGETLDSVMLDANIEASPVMFDNTVVVATRNGTIYGLEIK